MLNTTLKPALFFVSTLLLSNTAAAHCIANKLYAGAGFSVNSVDNFEDDAMGYQFFGGYCLGAAKRDSRYRSSLEVGYMDSGKFKKDVLVLVNRRLVTVTESTSYQGPWVNIVGEYRADQNVHLLGRLGADIGDDNGLMVGVGVGLNFSKWAQFRVEYVARENINSAQINWLTEF